MWTARSSAARAWRPKASRASSTTTLDSRKTVLLIYVLYGIFILACLALILSVLLQPGKADAGSLFTSSFSSTAFGPRGTQTLLAKISIDAAITFMLTALLISMGVGGYRSVIGSGDAAAIAPATTPAPAAEPPATEGAAQ